MNKIIILVFLFVSFLCQSNSQEEIPSKKIQLGLGPYIAWGGGTNISPVPDGRKNGFVLYRLPDVGAHFYMPLTDTNYIGWALDMGLTNYGFKVINFANDDEYVHHFGYITFNPQIVVGGFMTGITIAVPVFADYRDRNISTSNLNILTGMTMQYLTPIWSDIDGRINLFVKLSYLFTPTFDNYVKQDPLKIEIPNTSRPVNNSHNPRFASVTLGFSYSFNLVKASPVAVTE